MRNLDEKFKKLKIDHEKLLKYGFKKQNEEYIYKTYIHNKEFKINVYISNEKKYSKLIDLENNTEFILVDIDNVEGKFVGKIKQEYEDIIQNIIKKCTIEEIYTKNKCGLTGEILSRKVYEYLTTIPKGKVVTYKQVAESIGNKGLARVVGNILHKNPDGEKYPCYKVINSKGELARSFVFGGKDKQKARLEKDGIEVINNKVDLKKYQWI